MQQHLYVERYLQSLTTPSDTSKHVDTAFSFTALREGAYSESFALYTAFPPFGKHEAFPSTIRIPHHGEGPGMAFVKLDELGEATAKLAVMYRDAEVNGLASKEGKGWVDEYKNQIVLLSGPRSYTLAEVVEILGRVMGKGDVRIEEVSVEEYAADETVRKCLEPYGEKDVPRRWATIFEAISNGEASHTTKKLEILFRRDPEPVEKTVWEMVPQ